jgi:hypothetical protein
MNNRISRRAFAGTAFFAIAAGIAIAGSAAARNMSSMPRESLEEAKDHRVPVLVELFTSEGCSSCPPADKLLQDLQTRQPVAGARIIALSEHVDYWDRLGWKDPWSAAQYSARQVAYREAFKNSQVYTPQMVVDGQTEFLGSNRNAAQTAITRAIRQPKIPINLVRNGNVFSINVAALPQGTATTDVFAALVEDNLVSNVARGENEGRRLTHNAVAQQFAIIGTVSTRDAFRGTFTPKTTGVQKNQSVLVFLQEHGTHKIIGVEERPIVN